MGLLRQLAGRRVAKIDKARVDLFRLDEEEFSVEAQAIWMESAWPASFGVAQSPETAKDFTVVASTLVNGSRLRMPLLCVGLLTSTHFRWTPHRTYRGSDVYREPLNGILSEGTPREKGIYSRFPSRLLGPRSIPLQQIKRISITAFLPPDVAVLDVFMTDNCVIDEPGIWPIFDQSLISDVVPPVSLPEDTEARYLRMIGQGPAASNVATTWSRAFEYLAIPVQTEGLDEAERENWVTLRSTEPIEPWRTLSQRMADR